MTTLRREINDLIEARDVKNSEVFQKYFVQPVYERLDALKAAYDCDTLKELHRLKGEKAGLKFFINLLKSIDENIKIKENQLKADEGE